MAYETYLRDLADSLGIRWRDPYLWSLANGLDVLRKGVEKDLGVAFHGESVSEPSVTGEDRKPFRSGFLWRSRSSSWRWLLMRDHLAVAEKTTEHIHAFRNEGIAPGQGMVGALQNRILSTQPDSGTSFPLLGGVFDTLPVSPAINEYSAGYPETLSTAERALWPNNQFIGMSFLGAPRLTEEGLLEEPEGGHRDLDRLAEDQVGLIFVFCVGKEPIEPARVTHAFELISSVRKFFWQFLRENSPSLNEFSNALMRSAVSAIMARNMSHNIGSHVSLRARIGAIEDRLDQLYGRMPPLTEKQKLDIIRKLRTGLDDYIQKKSDFLAEITTEPLTTTKPARLYREVVVPFVSNTLLMDTLAANEGLEYQSKNQPRVLLRLLSDGREVKAIFAESTDDIGTDMATTYPGELPYTLHSADSLDFSKTGVAAFDTWIDHEGHSQPFDDIDVELPGPLGEYALFALLENFIRNSAKHNRPVLSGEARRLELCISVKDCSNHPGLYEVKLFDNVSDPSRPVTWQDRRSTATTAPMQLWEYVSDLMAGSFVEADGRLRKYAWGLAEMRICASLLGGSVDFGDHVPIVVSCEPDPRAEFRGQVRLVYTFHLMKARSICAIVRDLPEATHVADLRKKGVFLFPNRSALERQLDEASDLPAAFRFVVIDCPSFDADECVAISNLFDRLPFRRIVTAQTCEMPNGSMDNLMRSKAVHGCASGPNWSWPAKQIEHWCWSTWWKRWSPKPLEVNLALDQRPDESQTASWTKASEEFQRGGGQSISLRVWSKRDRGCDSTPAGVTGIFFDRHGDSIDKFHGDFLNGDSYVLLDKNNSDFAKLFQPAFPKGDDALLWTLPYQMAEAGLLRVAVIDERLAESCLRELSDDASLKMTHTVFGESVGPSIWHGAFASKVYVCTHLALQKGDRTFAAPLHGASYETWRQRASKPDSRVSLPFLELSVLDDKIAFSWRMDQRQENACNLKAVDAVIIHQGILDTIQDVVGLSPEDCLAALGRDIPFIVIDSGRGMPRTFAKFLPFSLLHDYVGETRTAKLSLTQVLMSLSRRAGKGSRWQESVA